MKNDTGADGDIPGWVILSANTVPERWRPRAKTIALVPLLPAEAAQLLSSARVEDDLAAGQLPLARLVAKGLSAGEIARELGISPRTVQRHVARLRDQFGVTTIQQLGTELARRAF